MELDSLTIEVLSEGRFEIFKDGHINRSDISEEDVAPEAGILASKSSAFVGINPILIKTGRQNVVIDPGLGWGLDSGSNYKDVSNVQTNLSIFGLVPEDITHVVLSHLHYDHAAGCSYTDTDARTRATFPNATYYVHQDEWDFALSQAEEKRSTVGAGYRLDDFYRLIADERVELLTGKQNNIIDGITAVRTGGHTPGHQAIIISNKGESAYYLGDLLPSAAHLNRYAMSNLDVDPIQAKKRKIQLLHSAFDQEASLLFYHSLFSNVGRLEKDREDQYVLKK